VRGRNPCIHVFKSPAVNAQDGCKRSIVLGVTLRESPQNPPERGSSSRNGERQSTPLRHLPIRPRARTTGIWRR